MEVHNVTADATTFTCNAYLIEGQSASMVDVGSMSGVEDVVENLSNEVDSVFITHQDHDHVDELQNVIDRFNPRVYAYADHPARTDSLSDGDYVEINGESFEVVYTPGHAKDHIAFISETTIFSGDVVVYNDGAFDDGSFGRTDGKGRSREDLIESIRRILDRLPDGVEHMYAGHGDEFHGDVQGVIETALHRAELREPKYPDE